MKLYLLYLGGQLAGDRMGEDHEVIAVVAENQAEAKKRAKVQWKGAGAPHIDAIRCLDTVDGYTISVTQAAAAPPSPLETDWAKLNEPDAL